MQPDLIARPALDKRALPRLPVALNYLAIPQVLDLLEHVGRGELARELGLGRIGCYGAILDELTGELGEGDEVALQSGGRNACRCSGEGSIDCCGDSTARGVAYDDDCGCRG